MERLITSNQQQDNVDMMLMPTLESQETQKLSVIAEFPIISKKTICSDKLNICINDFLTPELSKTLDQASISKERDLKPFWNQQSAEINSKLYLPTETDWQDSDLILSDGLLRKVVEKSWFSTKTISHRKPSSLKIFLQSSTSSPVGCTDLEVTKTKLLKISPTADQKKIFKMWTDCSRFVFNATIDYIHSCVNFTPSWMDVKKDMKGFLPIWCQAIPFQIKGIAIKEAHNAFFKAKGHPKFRSRKTSEQSCFIPKSAITQAGIYPRISGAGLYFHEKLPENISDSRLIWRHEKWWIAIPTKERLSRTENQGRIVALDPGVRNFITFYAPNYSGFIGYGNFGRIQRLCAHLDNLLSQRDKAINKQKKKAMAKASHRMQAKIKHLISELHFKTAKFLVDNFDVILIPTFETKNMVLKAKRKIGKKTARMLLSFSHYQFKKILKWKGLTAGKLVVDCCEAFTSKTNPETGLVKNIGSAKWVKLSNGSRVSRDIIGARNSMIRTLSFGRSPHERSCN